MAVEGGARTGDKRARILEAALDVCARRGVSAARMEEVATLAGVSKGTLYRYFESKEDLFLATLMDSYEASGRIFEALVDEDAPPSERLDQLLRALVEVLVSVSPRMELYYQAWGLVAADPTHSARLYGFLRAFHERQDEALGRTIREGQQAGAFRGDVDVDAFVDAFDALVGGFLYRSTFDRGRANAERLRASFHALMRDVLVAETKDGDA